MRRHLARLAAAAALVIPAGLVGAAPGQAAPCVGTSGVTVIVQWGDSLDVRCAPGDPTTGADALAKAGFGIVQVRTQPGFVCRISGNPSSDPCINTPPASAYWSYWHANPGQSWIYSNWGAYAPQSDPAPGSYQAWRFGSGHSPAYSVPRAAAFWMAPLSGTTAHHEDNHGGPPPFGHVTPDGDQGAERRRARGLGAGWFGAAHDEGVLAGWLGRFVDQWRGRAQHGGVGIDVGLGLEHHLGHRIGDQGRVRDEGVRDEERFRGAVRHDLVGRALGRRHRRCRERPFAGRRPRTRGHRHDRRGRRRARRGARRRWAARVASTAARRLR